jgi:hypothetical protein
MDAKGNAPLGLMDYNARMYNNQWSQPAIVGKSSIDGFTSTDPLRTSVNCTTLQKLIYATAKYHHMLAAWFFHKSHKAVHRPAMGREFILV